MPLTSSAKKALRRDKRKQADNYKIRAKVKKVVDVIRRGSNKPEDISKMQSILDRAAKKKVIHPKKSARMKSRLNKLVKTRTKKTAKPTKSSKNPKSSKKK